MFYYTFTTFDCNFIPRNAEICKVSSETKNVGKAHKYRLNRHLPTYEKIIKNLYSFFFYILLHNCKKILSYMFLPFTTLTIFIICSSERKISNCLFTFFSKQTISIDSFIIGFNINTYINSSFSLQALFFK